MTALGKNWHPHHFFCEKCLEPFKPDSSGALKYYLHDGKPYCGNDFGKLFAPSCAGCVKPILEGKIEHSDRTWHIDCFVCQVYLQNVGFASRLIFMSRSAARGLVSSTRLKESHIAWSTSQSALELRVQSVACQLTASVSKRSGNGSISTISSASIVRYAASSNKVAYGKLTWLETD